MIHEFPIQVELELLQCTSRKKNTAQKRVKQLNQCTSAETRQLITVVEIISAARTFLPSVMIFPGKHSKTHTLNGAPTNSVGLVSPIGRTTAELPPQVMEHFMNH
jgi:hypothetical protein